MKINFNGKQSLIITAAAAGTGLVIFGLTEAGKFIKNKKSKKNAEPEEEKTEPEETEDSE